MLRGVVYLAPSGQWSWHIFEPLDDDPEWSLDKDICAGAGYGSEAEAFEAMQEMLSDLS